MSDEIKKDAASPQPSVTAKKIRKIEPVDEFIAEDWRDDPNGDRFVMDLDDVIIDNSQAKGEPFDFEAYFNKRKKKGKPPK